MACFVIYFGETQQDPLGPAYLYKLNQTDQFYMAAENMKFLHHWV